MTDFGLYTFGLPMQKKGIKWNIFFFKLSKCLIINYLYIMWTSDIISFLLLHSAPWIIIAELGISVNMIDFCALV